MLKLIKIIRLIRLIKLIKIIKNVRVGHIKCLFHKIDNRDKQMRLETEESVFLILPILHQ